MRITFFISVFCIGILPGFSQSDTLQYLFIGHPNKGVFNTDSTDLRLVAADFSAYDQIWLGGDICGETSLKKSVIQYVTDLFNLTQPGNHFTYGNHDIRNGNLEWMEEITQKKAYYAYSDGSGLTTLVLNGNISLLDCDNLNRQFAMIKNVCDTISSGHLIILVHTGIYYGIPGVQNPAVYGHSQFVHWRANCYDSAATFLRTVYPMLVEVENRGVEVKHIMGDVGDNKKSFYAVSDDGIEFFGSGFGNTAAEIISGNPEKPDSVLIFKHVPATHYLGWEFIPASDL